MTKTFMRAALLSCAMLGPVLNSVPAEAGGSFGVTITAENREERRAISRFLRLYAAGSAAAEVIQNGRGNAAAIAQSGRGHRAVVSQQGDNHTAAVSQQGRGHRLGVFQFGQGTDVEVAQTGRNGAVLIFMGGW